MNALKNNLDNTCIKIMPDELNYNLRKCKNFEKFFHVFHHNIRSFHANYDQLSALLDEHFPKIDVLALSETWFNHSSCSVLEGYTGYHTFRVSSRGGGISVYISKNYRSTKNCTLSGIYTTFETCIVDVFVTNEMNIKLIGVYRPPSSSATEFNLEFGEFITNNFSSNSKCLIVGDFNIDIGVGGTHRTDLCNMFESISYNPLILIPTRLNNIIDHIWTNINSTFFSHVIENDITDHFITMTSFIGPIKSHKIP